jgi:S-formylglutathione hydrolase FrmB
MNPRSRHVFRTWALFTVILASLSAAYGQTAAKSSAGTLDDLQMPAPSLAGNLLNDATTQHVFVYLPPGYKLAPERRYPTLYLLHGYTGRPEEWVRDGYQGMSLATEMDSLISKGISSEMIVVVPNGRNAYLGSYYTNSSVTGNWEDYIYRDLVSYVDGRYRTIANASGRGIAGHSMGGYGAFMIAMKHPDVFGAVYAMSPCCLGFEGDMTADNPTWAKAAQVNSRDRFTAKPQSFEDFWVDAMISVSAAFAPNRERAPIYADFPFVAKNGHLVRNEPAYSAFRSKMPLYLVEEYRANLMKLRGIAVDVGELDQFTHIRRTVAKLSAELSDREIPHAFEIYKDGNHGNKIRERFDTRVIPFFTTMLQR